jgi:hypothetical protein
MALRGQALFWQLPRLPALADTTRDEVLAGVARCGVIHDNKVWLDCVYGAQQPMRAMLGLTPAPELQQRLVPGASNVPPPSPVTATARPGKKQDFFERMVATEIDTAPRMKEYHFEKGGAFVITLENGQEWRQKDVKRQGQLEPSAFLVPRAGERGRIRRL